MSDDGIDNPGYLMYEAQTCHQKGEYFEALTIYTKIINLKPDYAEAYRQRGYIKEAMGNYKSCYEDYDKSIELDPEDPENWFFRGRCLKLNPDYQDR